MELCYKHDSSIEQQEWGRANGVCVWCVYGVIKVEKPTSGSSRCVKYCKKYKKYCFNQCGKKTEKPNYKNEMCGENAK